MSGPEQSSTSEVYRLHKFCRRNCWVFTAPHKSERQLTAESAECWGTRGSNHLPSREVSARTPTGEPDMPNELYIIVITSAYSTHLQFGGNEMIWGVTSEGQRVWGRSLPEVGVWGCASMVQKQSPGQKICGEAPINWKRFAAQSTWLFIARYQVFMQKWEEHKIETH